MKFFTLQPPQCEDLCILGLPLYTTVPAEIVVVTIPVVLTVRLVMFMVEADQVPQGEAVVAGHEVDAVEGVAPLAVDSSRCYR